MAFSKTSNVKKTTTASSYGGLPLQTINLRANNSKSNAPCPTPHTPHPTGSISLL
ncbi:MAG: hypothetical protein F6J93_38740 [Oscillatoria sp. SIO1A7]|nr:hypothetical protein [Oscillatoria sp. SIO1A7]